MLISPYDRNMLQNARANIFVKNLGLTATNRMLFDIFRRCGDIFSSKVAQNLQGKSKGYGFVQYRDPEAAAKAIAELNGFKIEDKTLVVEAYKRTERKEKTEKGFTNIFVKNLPPSVATDEALGKLFEAYGARLSMKISEHELKGKKGFFGFINFQTPEQAVKAVAEMNGKTIEGVQLYVVKALNKEQREREKLRQKIEQRAASRKFTLHVKTNSGDQINEALIRQELQPFGEIKNITIRSHKTAEGQDTNEAVAFVVMAREEDATRVFLHNYSIGCQRLFQNGPSRRQSTRRTGAKAGETAAGEGRTHDGVWIDADGLPDARFQRRT